MANSEMAWPIAGRSTASEMHARFMLWAAAVESMWPDPAGGLDRRLDSVRNADPDLYDLIVRSALKTAVDDESCDSSAEYRRMVRDHYGRHSLAAAESSILAKDCPTGIGRGRRKL